jgi:peptidoglycan/LPS O-acetylase OafA/YrhL
MKKPRSPGLDGLRGIAVAAVVIEHAWPNMLPGGFTGVDMFFVLSGFLITAQLLGEHERTGEISLRAFYARRVKRIFPASILVIMITGITWALLFGPGLANEVLRSLSAASASLSNFYFRALSLDYFQAGSGSSPVLHYWSLAVEEQFYLAYPIILIIIEKLAKRYIPKISFPRIVASALAVLSVISFGTMLAASSGAAFYLPWFRAWELGAGGIVAYLFASRPSATMSMTTRLRRVLLVTGSVGLTVAFVFSATFSRWPGYESIIPVAATCLLIIGLFNASTNSMLFSSVPLRFLGRISFALYLWHWVLLGISDNLSFPGLRGDASTLLAILAALALATASTVLFEEPIRALDIGAPHRAQKTILAGGFSILFTLGFLNLGAPALARFAGLGTPLAESLSQVREDFGHFKDQAGLFPTTSDFRDDYNPCEYGAAQIAPNQPNCDGTTLPKVVLLGDSHALAWFPAINGWAVENGYAVIMLGRASCSPFNIELSPAQTPSNCSRWANEVWTRVKHIKPDLLVIATSGFSKIVVGGVAVFPAKGGKDWISVAVSQMSGIHSSGIRVLLIGEIPRARFNIPDCLALHRTDLSACEIPIAGALPGSLVLNQQQAAASAGISYWNPAELICPAGVCTWVWDNQVMFIDPGHLSASMAASLKNSVGAVIRSVLLQVAP